MLDAEFVSRSIRYLLIPFLANSAIVGHKSNKLEKSQCRNKLNNLRPRKFHCPLTRFACPIRLPKQTPRTPSVSQKISSSIDRRRLFFQRDKLITCQGLRVTRDGAILIATRKNRAATGWPNERLDTLRLSNPEDSSATPVPASLRRLSARTRHRSAVPADDTEDPLHPCARSKERNLREGYAPPTRVAVLRFPRASKEEEEEEEEK